MCRIGFMHQFKNDRLMRIRFVFWNINNRVDISEDIKKMLQLNKDETCDLNETQNMMSCLSATATICGV